MISPPFVNDIISDYYICTLCLPVYLKIAKVGNTFFTKKVHFLSSKSLKHTTYYVSDIKVLMWSRSGRRSGMDHNSWTRILVSWYSLSWRVDTSNGTYRWSFILIEHGWHSKFSETWKNHQNQETESIRLCNVSVLRPFFLKAMWNIIN